MSYVDGLPNFPYVTRIERDRAATSQLEKGINGYAVIDACDGGRRPAILIRLSRWKAGTPTTPWADELDRERGILTYFGDHKPTTRVPLGTTHGNGQLLQAWELHPDARPEIRTAAPPLIVFEATNWFTPEGELRQKGAVRFLGPGVIDQMEQVTEPDPNGTGTFPNYRFTVRLLNINHPEQLIDWRWINDRRDPTLTASGACSHEPETWRSWRKSGLF